MNATNHCLIQININWLNQALALLAAIGDRPFITVPEIFAPHKAASHLRHIIEFYECFLSGVESGQIDYDSRQRDLSLEASRAAASARIRTVIARLNSTPSLLADSALLVKIEDASAHATPNPYVASSVARELQTLSSHTIHHFALIALTLRAHGLTIDPNFGMAPSTLRHLEAAA